MDHAKQIRVTREDVLQRAAYARLAGSDVSAEVMAKREGKEFADVQITFIANGYELIAALTANDDIPDDDDMDMSEHAVVEALLEGCVVVDCYTPWPDEAAEPEAGKPEKE